MNRGLNPGLWDQILDSNLALNIQLQGCNTQGLKVTAPLIRSSKTQKLIFHGPFTDEDAEAHLRSWVGKRLSPKLIWAFQVPISV